MDNIPKYTSTDHYRERPAERAQGLRVLAVVPDNGEEASFVFAKRQICSLIAAGINVRTLSLHSRTSLAAIVDAIRQLRRDIREFEPHLLHAHYGTVTSFLCAVSSRVPLVITFRGSDLNGDADANVVRSYFAQLLSQLSALRARATICVSARLRERLWWRRKQAVVIPDGVDLQAFCPQPLSEARASLGWEGNTFIVLCRGGACRRGRGLDLLEAAIDRVQKLLGPARLALLDGNVRPGAVSQWVNAADCVAVASLREGSPNIVKEALACNVPVVSTDVGDVAERLEGVHPSAVVAYAVEQFAAGLVQVLGLRQRSNGRERVDLCSTESIARRIADLYAELVSPEPHTAKSVQAGANCNSVESQT